MKALLDEARAARLNYRVRELRSPGGRRLVVLGEVHVKPRSAGDLGRRIVDAFPLRGVESFQADQVFAGRYTIGLVHGLHVIVRLLSLGLLEGSTITYARSRPQGRTVLLERTEFVPLALHVGSLHLAVIFTAFALAVLFGILGIGVPFFIAFLGLLELHLIVALPLALALRRRKWGWLVLPVVAILTARDELMAWGTVKMLEDNPGTDPALVIMGRAHVRGVERELVTKYGFVSEG
jgi:Fe2+ transport system protein FeoA